MTPTPSSISVDITVDEPPHSRANPAHGFPPDLCLATLTRAAQLAASFRHYDQGQLGIRICDDAEIRQINRRHLQHDYATDVISFGYTDQPPCVEGELVVSWETASRTAASLPGWSVQNELVLYVVHGVLHICAMDDQDPVGRAAMRAAELAVLTQLGITDISRFGADEAETCEHRVNDTTVEAN